MLPFFCVSFSLSQLPACILDHVVLTISDTGPGMPPEVLAHAFESFFTTKSATKGTGLGPAQVDGFVRQTGSYVAIDPEIGHGVTIEIFLPR